MKTVHAHVDVERLSSAHLVKSVQGNVLQDVHDLYAIQNVVDRLYIYPIRRVYANFENLY
jgi:hypothetical protein